MIRKINVVCLPRLKQARHGSVNHASVGRRVWVVQDVRTVPAIQNQNTGREGWGLLPECARTSSFATARRAVPARAPFPRAPISAMAVLPEMSPHRMRFFIKAFISPHAARNHCSLAAFWLRNQQPRSSNDPDEAVPTRWPEQEASGHYLSPTHRYYGVPKRDRRRYRPSGELRAQSCQCPVKQSTFSTSHHFPASSHHVTPRTRQLQFATPSQCNFLQTRVVRFFRRASCRLGHRLRTFGCAQLTQRGPGSVPKCRGRTNSTGNGSAPTPSQ